MKAQQLMRFVQTIPAQIRIDRFHIYIYRFQKCIIDLYYQSVGLEQRKVGETSINLPTRKKIYGYIIIKQMIRYTAAFWFRLKCCQAVFSPGTNLGPRMLLGLCQELRELVNHDEECLSDFSDEVGNSKKSLVYSNGRPPNHAKSNGQGQPWRIQSA